MKSTLLLLAATVSPFADARLNRRSTRHDGSGSHVQKRATVINGFTYQGCYADVSGHLSGYYQRQSNMTLETCFDLCGSRSYTYAGLEAGTDCYCSNTNSLTVQTADAACYIDCDGNSAQNCGGTVTVSLYKNTGYSAINAASVSASLAASQSAANAASVAASLAASQSAANAASVSASLAASQSAANVASASASLAASKSAATAASVSASLAASQSAANAASVAASLAASQSAANAASVAASLAASQSAANAASVAASLAASQSAANAASASASLAASKSAANDASVSASLAASQSAANAASVAASLAASQSAANAASASASLAASKSAANAASQSAADAAAASSLAASRAASLSASLSASAAAAAAPASSSSSSSSATPSSSPAKLPSGWAATQPSVVAEGTSGRALTGASKAGSTMTPTECINYCNSQGFILAGVEYGSECYCGNTLSNGASLTKTATGSMACAGDSTQICGGGNAISLFVLSSSASNLNSDYTASTKTSSTTVTLPTGWTAASSSCIAEGTSGRALTGASTTSDDMTIEKCVSYCSTNNFAYAGIEYARECYCGNTLTNGASLSTASSNCNMKCAGNSQEICGGGGALSLYNNPSLPASGSGSGSAASSAAAVKLPSGWSAASTPVIAEGTSGRALTGTSFASDDMTITKCVSYCNTKNFAYAGIEYARECYCGNTLDNGASLSKTATASMSCAGDSTQICGGGNALSLYYNPSLPAAVASSSASSTASSAAAVTLPSGWSTGSPACIQEVSGRALNAASTSSSSMTIATCIKFCAGKGFQYAGLEYASECYCALSLTNPTESSKCKMACSGDSTQTCGGPNAIQIYQNPSLATNTVVNGFTSSGCIQEVSGRALTGASTSASNMTIEKCTSYCSGQRFKYAGVEYGSECYCGSSLVNGASSSLTSGQCNMACSGQADQTCGGPNAINLYISA